MKKQAKSTTDASTKPATANQRTSRDILTGQAYKVIEAAYNSIPTALCGPGDFSFTRNGVLSVELLTTFLTCMVADGNRSGIRHLTLNFWEDAAAQGVLLPCVDPVSASAICQARQRLPESLFRCLLTALADEAGCGAATQRWKGKRVYAVDGALINLNRSPDLVDAFGMAKGTYTPQIRLSALVDVFNRAPIAYEVDGRMKAGEREHLIRMLPLIRPGDLAILDRGYPSGEVLLKCGAAGIDFLIRCPSSQTFAFIDAFRESGESDTTITTDLALNGSPEAQSVKLRLVRIDGPNGPSFYITSLAPSIASVKEISDLYHLRWQVEEYFKLFTSEYAGQKQFRSTSPKGVRQEIGALLPL